jgi:tRNA pseudouridine32 synthase/23S rRNA pseudouridine746 synthase/23S rRNA pseudouridine1911/1915/1917 synthase
MQEKAKSSVPPKKFHPKGLSILYEDRDIIVVDKVQGLLTVSSDTIQEQTAYYLLNEYVRKKNAKSKNRVFIVHRLDRDTSGIMVFAKSEKAKDYLQEKWHSFQKKYYAVVHGALPEKAGVITSYLAENSVYKVYSVSDPKKGKLSTTRYRCLQQTKKYSLLEVTLETGRKNQIRVHLAEQGCPVVGDDKYGKKEKGIRRLSLHAFSLTFLHPHTQKSVSFESKMPDYFKALMADTRP